MRWVTKGTGKERLGETCRPPQTPRHYFRFLLVAFCILDGGGLEACSANERFDVNLLPKVVPGDSHIVSFALTLSPGHVEAVTGLPRGWAISIVNGYDEKVHLTGSVAVGGEPLMKSDLSTIRFGFQSSAILGSSFTCGGTVVEIDGSKRKQTLPVGSHNCLIDVNQANP
jgi:hypothetical protein